VLVPFGERLWIAEGPTVQFLGQIPYPTRMAVARLPDDSLWVWSPIALDEGLAAEVDALGGVRHLVSPNKIHHLFMGEWAERYPQARMYAPPGLAKKRSDLHFDAELGDDPDPSWGGDIDPLVFRGSFFLEELLFFHRPSRTAIVGDLVQRFEPGWIPGWKGRMMELWGLVGENGSTPREWRASFLRRGQAREAKRTALSWNPERLLIAHGMCAETDGRAVLDRGLGWLG
jgi:hypothetical protein